MKPARQFKIGRLDAFRPAYHIGCRRARRPSASLPPGLRFWARPKNYLPLLCLLVRRILKFHDTHIPLGP